jgi:integrase/recombinase XerC
MHTTMSTLTHRYVQQRRSRQEITAATAIRMRTVLASFDRSYGARPVGNLSRCDIERWMEGRSHLAAGTRRNELSIMRGFVAWLQSERHMKRNPLVGVRPPKVPRSIPRALTRTECDAVAAVLPDARAHAIFALMRRCGLRRCEVLGLEVGDWDRAGESLRVVGKGGHERLVPVPDDVAVVLSAYVVWSAGPMVRTLDGARGISSSYLGRLVSGWMVEAGVKVAPFDGRACHSFRHSIASEVADTTGDLRVVQELLGHRSLTSTQVYLRRVVLGQVRAALDAAA